MLEQRSKAGQDISQQEPVAGLDTSGRLRGEKFVWDLKPVDRDLVNTLSDQLFLSRSLVQVLCRRGYITREQIQEFLFVTEQIVPDGKLLHGAEKAVDRILAAIEKNEKILIFGDYDVDGITSSAIMLSALLPLGAQINYFLPNRARDGYGFSEKYAQKAVEHGYGVIVTVDNGTTSHAATELAQDNGIDVIITDHHQPHGELPPAYVLVNPHQKDCPYPYKQFAGVGVIFKVMDLLYKKLGKTLPEKAYELLMLGTVADVVPLVHENRYWVQYGLAKINKEKSFAIQTLLRNGGCDTKSDISSRDVGFSLAPQLNALGRLDDARDGVIFLISSDYERVKDIGVILKNINEERKRVDRGIYDEIVAQIEAGKIDLETERCIVAGSYDWPAGVIGLVAGKLMQNYGRPVMLFHLTKNGLAKGSCRSIPEFNIFDALAENEEILRSFGGHACAAGLALKISDVPVLKKNIEARIARLVKPEDLVPKIRVEGEMTLPDVNKKLIDDLRILEPFGNSNEQPVFKIDHVTILQEPKLLKDKHVKALIFADGVIKPIMFFNRPELYKKLIDLINHEFSVAATVSLNEWNGKKSIELQGLDILV